MEYTFRILRYDPKKNDYPYFQDFFYESLEKKSLLEAMMEIRNKQDSTLSFRYSCREAICGSCALVINGEFGLACRMDLGSLKSSSIVLEPLANLEIQKDLIVNLNPFWEALNKVEPYLHFEGDIPEEGYRIEDKEMDKIFQFVNCILCGCCYSACPVSARDNNYLGPAALAKLFRFVNDPRDKRHFASWSSINTEGGVWGCDSVFKCNDVCPKNVRPADGITSLRRKLVVEKIKRILGSRR